MIYAVLFVLSTGFGRIYAEEDSFIRAVHYYGDHAPYTFFGSAEHQRFAEDFSRIKNDGFNTLIIVTPWWTGMKKDRERVGQHYESLLRRIFEEANRTDLNVILRLGYPHDNVQLPGSVSRDACISLISLEEDTLNDWLQYLTRD